MLAFFKYENIVQHEVQVVQHVVINHRIHIIQVMHVVMHVVGRVMHDIIKMEAHVQHVEYENGHLHDMQHVVIVQIHQRMQNIQVMQLAMLVVGDVKHDTIRVEANVKHVQADIQVLHEQRQQLVVIGHVVHDII